MEAVLLNPTTLEGALSNQTSDQYQKNPDNQIPPENRFGNSMKGGIILVENGIQTGIDVHNPDSFNVQGVPDRTAHVQQGTIHTGKEYQIKEPPKKEIISVEDKLKIETEITHQVILHGYSLMEENEQRARGISKVPYRRLVKPDRT